jgi:hypothetical protein
MSMFSKLTGLAKKALDNSGSSNRGANSGQTDWRGMVRSAADALTGDGRASESGRRHWSTSSGPPGRPELLFFPVWSIRFFRFIRDDRQRRWGGDRSLRLPSTNC